MPPANVVDDARVEALEAALDALNADLPPLREFILPAEAPGPARCTSPRRVCRRAERGLVALAADEPVSEVSRRYINRLSDYLFVAARVPRPRRFGRGLLEAQAEPARRLSGGPPRPGTGSGPGFPPVRATSAW